MRAKRADQRINLATKMVSGQAAVAAVPLAALLLETDSPSMPLAGYQGERNEPARLVEVLQQLAALRQQPIETLTAGLEANVERLFFAAP